LINKNLTYSLLELHQAILYIGWRKSMNELLNSLDENLDTAYFTHFDRYIKNVSHPLNLEEFMKLEMKFYDRYQKMKDRQNKKEFNLASSTV
jgi:hypothetical protein